MSEYIKQAKDFLAKHGATCEIKFDYYGRVWGDYRNVYEVTIERNGNSYTFSFKDSVYNSNMGNEPTAYDVLACLEKYGYDSYGDFCSELGYGGGEESLETYQAVQEEYENVVMLFGDCMEELQEIC